MDAASSDNNSVVFGSMKQYHFPTNRSPARSESAAHLCFETCVLPCSIGSDSTLSATSALDSIVKDADLVFIDVRSSNEKQSGGVPDVPSSVSGKVIEVEFASVEDKKLRGALRDPSYIEAQVRGAVKEAHET